MPPHRLKYRQGDRVNKKKNPPFLPALSCVPINEFLKLGVRQAMPSLGRKMRPKWRLAALWAGNVNEAIWAMILNTRAQEPQCSFFHRSHLQTPLHCKMAPPSSPMAQHEAPRHGLTQPIQQSIASILLHHTSKFASVQTQESCSLLRHVNGKPAIMPFSSNCRSCLTRFCTAPSSCSALNLCSSPLSLTSRPFIMHSRHVVC